MSINACALHVTTPKAWQGLLVSRTSRSGIDSSGARACFIPHPTPDGGFRATQRAYKGFAFLCQNSPEACISPKKGPLRSLRCPHT